MRVQRYLIRILYNILAKFYTSGVLSKKDITTIKKIFFERINLLEESLVDRFISISKEIAIMKVDINELNNCVDKIGGSYKTLNKNLQSLQEATLNTNSYIEKELRVNLDQLEEGSRNLQKRIEKIEKD